MEKPLKKALFIDRDGTIVAETVSDEFHVGYDNLQFLPGAISGMKVLAGLDYELVMASNQDGLGTASYPEEIFWGPHRLILGVLASEGVFFDDQLIDHTMPADNSPTRKPDVGMFGKYLSGDYDMAASYVIGDRITDVRLAANLGARAIFIQPREKGREMAAAEGLEGVCALITEDWREIAGFLRLGERMACVRRTTRETDISVDLDLDGRGESGIDTGLGFLDHMLDQLVHHGGISLKVHCKGDLHVDEHHTIEDVAIALGEALYRALGDMRGMERYGFALPMDESAALVLLDFGGRSDLEWDVRFSGERIGDVPAQMMPHFFKSLCSAARCNLRVSARGANDHHVAEAIFKALARSIKAAVRRDVFNRALPSSKGVL